MSQLSEPSTAPAFRKTAETFRPGAKTLPQSYFVSADVFAQEQEGIFARQWLCVGHQSQLARSGDFFRAEVIGESLIVLRDQQGIIRGFYNVCRHRGTRLCEEGSGHSAVIQCPYHAWTYALDGRLIGAPHMDDAAGFEKSDYSLATVHLQLWEGFIFLNLAPEAKPLDEVFAPLNGKFAHWNLSRLRSGKRIEYDVRANWKLIFENYSECYHCPGVHPMLSKVSPYDSAENDLTEGPFLGGFMAIKNGASLTMSGNACALPVGDIKADDHARVFYYSIFPNMLLSMHPDYVMVHLLWPLAPDRTRIVCDWFFHPEAAEHIGFNPEDAVEFWDITNQQDWHVCELSQQGISSRAYRPGPYSPRESIPAAWDREYLRHMG
ncbi:MAG TPA: aromatic ring-hydroxylating dioxygenase subunit alpha [Chthoniobacterales bacterium]|nr:aromatic ring-hydroxylating dioxygenase subunit alpha [Chthoniobacterales bacterium]